MYNVKVKNRNGQVQTRIYSHTVYEGAKEKPEEQDIEFNPFDGGKCKEYQDLKQLDEEQERSLQVSLQTC